MTIYALSTAHGVSGLAVIRVSGHLALTALKTLTRKSHFEVKNGHDRSFFKLEKVILKLRVTISGHSSS